MMPHLVPAYVCSARWQSCATWIRSSSISEFARNASADATSIAAEEANPAPIGTSPLITRLAPETRCPACVEGRGHSTHVVAPIMQGTRSHRVEIEFPALLEIQRIHLNVAIVARTDRNIGVELQRRGHHKAVVVVGVLPDEVHPPRSAKQCASACRTAYRLPHAIARRPGWADRKTLLLAPPVFAICSCSAPRAIVDGASMESAQQISAALPNDELSYGGHGT